MYRRNVAGQHVGFVLIAFADGQVLLGVAPDVVVWISKDGGTQFAGVGLVTELGNGQYDYAPDPSELDAAEVSMLFTMPDAVAVEKTLLTTACDPQNALTFGIQALPAALPATPGGLVILGDNAGFLQFSVPDLLTGASLIMAGGFQISGPCKIDCTASPNATALTLSAGSIGQGLEILAGVTQGDGVRIQAPGNGYGTVIYGGAPVGIEVDGGSALSLQTSHGAGLSVYSTDNVTAAFNVVNGGGGPAVEAASGSWP